MANGVEAVWERPALRWLLAPLSLAYAAGWTAYRSVYDWGWKRPYRPAVPSVCVGNLRVGGSGKTPFAAYTARLLQAAGRQPVLSMSGYGSSASRGAALAPSGPLDPARWGDEPALVRDWLPGVPIVAGRDRVLAAQTAEREFPGCTLVLDDGFQHLRLRCRAQIVLDQPEAAAWCLPGGPYREPRRPGLRRADLVLPNPWLHVSRQHSLRSTSGGPAPWPTEAQIVTAVARPETLAQLAQSKGTTVVRVLTRRDHDPLDEPGLWHGLDPRTPILTTAKDWVKLRARPDSAPAPLLVADYTCRAEPEQAFVRWLLETLDAPESQAAVRPRGR